MFIDVHCHLEMLEDVERIVDEAKKKRIGRILGAGINYETNRKVLEFSKKFDCVKSCMGLYPIEGLKMSEKGILEEINFIYKQKDKILGIGEVGIDLKENKEFNEQKNIFFNFIKLALSLDKPLIVHSRKAEEEVLSILENLRVKKVVMHCFSGNLKLVKKIVENGWFLSIPTSIVFNHHFQRLVEETPIESLLCETDSPFLSPYKKYPNTPKNIIESYKKIANLKNVDLKYIEKKIEKNYFNLFENENLK